MRLRTAYMLLFLFSGLIASSHAYLTKDLNLTLLWSVILLISAIGCEFAILEEKLNLISLGGN